MYTYSPSQPTDKDVAFYIRLDCDFASHQDSFEKWSLTISSACNEFASIAFGLNLNDVSFETSFYEGSVWIRIRATGETLFKILVVITTLNATAEMIEKRWELIQPHLINVVETVTQSKVVENFIVLKPLTQYFHDLATTSQPLSQQHETHPSPDIAPPPSTTQAPKPKRQVRLNGPPSPPEFE